MNQGQERDDFIPVVKKNTKSVKTNTTFRLIETLLQEKSEFILNSGYECVALPGESTSAYLFKDPSRPENLHFELEGFEFIERHLRVDSEYSLSQTFKGQHGFTAAHYTENYQHPQSKEKITIHFYYADSCQYVQIKKTSGKENTEWLDAARIEKTIRHNAYAMIMFYKKLSMEKNNRYILALKAADMAENEIKKMWRTLASKEQIQKYIEAIDRFCVLINDVNFYNEFETDCRDVFMRNIRSTLIARIEIFTGLPPADKPSDVSVEQSNLPTQKSVAVATDTPAKETSPPSKTNLAPIDTEFEQLTQLATTLRRFSKKMTPEKFVQAIGVAEELNLNLLLYNPPIKANKNKIQQLKEMERLLRSVPDVYEYCLAFAMKGDLKAVTTLFAILKFDMLYNLFWQLHDQLLQPDFDDKSELAHNLRALCNFFHESSPHYNIFIRLSSSMIGTNLDTKVGCSRLVSAALQDKYLTYSMLIDHGIDVNGVGFLCADQTFSYLKALAILAPTPTYVIKLLENGATVDAPQVVLSLYWQQTKVVQRASLKKLFDKATRFDKKNHSDNHDYYEKMRRLAVTPDLSLACIEEQFVCIPVFLPHIKLMNAVHALGQCFNQTGISKRLLPFSTQRGLFICASRNEADKISNSISVPAGLIKNVALIAYLTDDAFIVSLPHIKRLMNFVKEQCQLNPQNILPLIQTLEVMATKIHIRDRDVYYYAMEILFAELMHDDRTIDATMNAKRDQDYRQQLMRTCCLFGTVLKTKRPEYAFILYQEAKMLAEENPSLQSTPIYQHALKQYETTKQSSTYQANVYRAAPQLRFVVTLAKESDSDSDDDKQSNIKKTL